MSENKASATWHGGLKEGGGTVSTGHKLLNDAPYSFKSRFEDGAGTNPEELVGAAHAGCFTMMLSLVLGQHGVTAEVINTSAKVTLDTNAPGGPAVTKIHLDVHAKIPGGDPAVFQEAAQKAKTDCPISRLLKTDITMEAKLES